MRKYRVGRCLRCHLEGVQLSERYLCQGCHRELWDVGGLDPYPTDRSSVPEWLEFMDRPEKGCWIWPGSRTVSGIPRHGPKQTISVRRWVWETEHNALRPGEKVWAKCGTKGCIRLDHLWVRER